MVPVRVGGPQIHTCLADPGQSEQPLGADTIIEISDTYIKVRSIGNWSSACRTDRQTDRWGVGLVVPCSDNTARRDDHISTKLRNLLVTDTRHDGTLFSGLQKIGTEPRVHPQGSQHRSPNHVRHPPDGSAPSGKGVLRRRV